MAGLQRGDTIAEVNGQPSAQVGLLVLRDLFANEGRRVELLVHRSGWRNLVSLETRRVH
jgi:C-terminal processing protease CtpA/Prc